MQEQSESKTRGSGAHQFTCEHCGSHDLRYRHETNTTTHSTATLYCKCDRNVGLPAAERTTYRTVHLTETGTVDGHGLFHEDDRQTDDTGKVLDGRDTRCRKCAGHAADDDWELTQESTTDADATYLECGDCGKEVEFGWTDKNARRFMLVDDPDFQPYLCEPDPHFRALWEKRGWISTNAVAHPNPVGKQTPCPERQGQRVEHSSRTGTTEGGRE